MKTTHRPWTVVALLLAMFMAAMEFTVVSTAMPTAVGQLGGIELYAWVFAAYMLVSTIGVPIFGKLADLYGRKPVMLAGTAVFFVGSLLCGLSPSMPVLIAARALQGLGAGAMQPMAMTIVGDLFELRERARMQGIFGAVWGFAGLIGPLLGGLIVKELSWPWVFFINLPFAAGSFLVLSVAFHEQVQPRLHRLDLGGAALLSAGVLAVLFGARAGASSAPLLVPLVAGIVLAFLRTERRAAEPILPLDLFARRIMATSSAAGALIGAAMFSMVTYVPLYVQGVLGGTPTQAGSVITPMAIGWPIASTIGGRLLPHTGFRPLVCGGLLCSALAAVGLAAFLRPGADLNVGRLLTAFFGLGLGFANVALLLAVQSSVEWQRRGVATASTMFFRTIGGTLSVGVLGGLLSAALVQHGAAGASVERLLSHGHESIDPARLGELASVLGTALVPILWAVGGISAAAFAVSLLFPRLEVSSPEMLRSAAPQHPHPDPLPQGAVTPLPRGEGQGGLGG